MSDNQSGARERRFRDEAEATAWAGFMAAALGRMSAVTACERDADRALEAMRARRDERSADAVVTRERRAGLRTSEAYRLGLRDAATYCEQSAGVFPDPRDERGQGGHEAVSAMASFLRAVSDAKEARFPEAREGAPGWDYTGAPVEKPELEDV